MGFSLEMFFKELLTILNSEQNPDKLHRLRKEIESSYAYAQQCGQVSKDGK